MRLSLLVAFLTSACLFGAIGDNAPSVPPSWVTSHPRLPFPDNAFLQAICTNNGNPGSGVTNGGDGCHMAPRYRTAANGASPNTLVAMRYQLIAYAATVWNGTPNAALLTKIKGFSTDYTSASTITPWALSMAYDWFHTAICGSDGGTIISGACVGSSTLDAMRTTMYAQQTAYWATCQVSGFKPSPYNDQAYITSPCSLMQPLLEAVAIYPDDSATSLPFLRKGMDYMFNIVLSSWQTVFGEYPYAAAASSFLGGGGWHESWSGDYIIKAGGMTTWIIPSLLAYASASGKGTAYVFGTTCGTVCNPDQYPWLKNFAYFPMYIHRPDWVSEPIDNSNSAVYFLDDYSNQGTPNGGTGASNPGVMDGLAAIYNDPVLRYWSRLVNWSTNANTVQTPDGLEPTAWPYFQPDNCGTGATCILPLQGNLALVRDFPGWGVVFFRTGWGEDDSYCWLKYGNQYWSHPAANAGAWGCANRGALAIHSSGYISGSNSYFAFLWAGAAISQNTIGICDPNDRYSDETFGMYSYLDTSASGARQSIVAPNDCGERKNGSGYSNRGNLAGHQQSPFDGPHWNRGREFYHYGKLVAFSVHPSNFYAYATVDVTASYNNKYSLGTHTGAFNPFEMNSINRSPRAQKVVRHFLWVPRGQAAYVVMYDQVISRSASFTKKWLLHSINQPSISGNSYTITRADTVTSPTGFKGAWPKAWGGFMTHCPGGCLGNPSQYVYNGKLTGWYTWPTTGVITTIGGPGQEFLVKDPANSANDINLNECMQYQCSSDFGTVIATANSAPVTITTGVNDTLAVKIDGGATQNITLAPGTNLTCAALVTDLNAKTTGGTWSCQGMQTPLSILALSSTNKVFTSCSGGTPSATCSAVAILSGTAAATLSLPSGSAADSLVCAASYYGTATGGVCSSTGARAGFDIGMDAIGGFLHPNPLKGPQQPGSWRFEETIGASNLSDQFLNVMLVDSASSANVVSTVPVTTSTTLNSLPALSTTWKDNSNNCTYTAIFYVDGVGGTVSATGAGCANQF